MHDRAIICSMCGGKFFPASLSFHQKACARKNAAVLVPCPYCKVEIAKGDIEAHCKTCPPARAAMKKKREEAAAAAEAKGNNGTSQGFKSSGFDVNDFLGVDAQGLMQCSYCNRKFSQDRLGKHQDICSRLHNKKRSHVFDSFTQRQVDPLVQPVTADDIAREKIIMKRAKPQNSSSRNPPRNAPLRQAPSRSPPPGRSAPARQMGRPASPSSYAHHHQQQQQQQPAFSKQQPSSFPRTNPPPSNPGSRRGSFSNGGIGFNSPSPINNSNFLSNGHGRNRDVANVYDAPPPKFGGGPSLNRFTPGLGGPIKPVGRFGVATGGSFGSPSPANEFSGVSSLPPIYKTSSSGRSLSGGGGGLRGSVHSSLRPASTFGGGPRFGQKGGNASGGGMSNGNHSSSDNPLATDYRMTQPHQMNSKGNVGGMRGGSSSGGGVSAGNHSSNDNPLVSNPYMQMMR